MNYRKKLIKLFTFLGGIYFFLEFVLPPKIGGFDLEKYNDPISNGFVAIGALTFGLGLINLLAVHGSKIVFRRSGAVNSFALLLGLFAMTYVAAQDWMSGLSISSKTDQIFHLKEFAERITKDNEEKTKGVPELSFRREKLFDAVREAALIVQSEAGKISTDALGAEDPDVTLIASYKNEIADELTKVNAALTEGRKNQATTEDLPALGGVLGELGSSYRGLLTTFEKHTSWKEFYTFLYDGLFVALGSAMFALLGFYIAGAAYRAFRIKSLESGLMMAAALLVMLGQIPFGIWLWSGFPEVRLWVLTIPNAAAFRAISIGAGVAGLVMAFKMWFSIESESFGEK